MHLLHYVGPPEIGEQAKHQPAGQIISHASDAVHDPIASAIRDENGWATYVITVDGALRVAPRRTEHVACAAGGPVLTAGEVRFGPNTDVLEISNNSTGFCPPEDTWPVVERALEQAGFEHPGGFTFVAVFRRCEQCGQRNLVKDEWFECAVCGADLPKSWNFDR